MFSDYLIHKQAFDDFIEQKCIFVKFLYLSYTYIGQDLDPDPVKNYMGTQHCIPKQCSFIFVALQYIQTKKFCANMSNFLLNIVIYLFS
jgi:hypothetical protein